jgi:hypothetical protein
MEESWVSASTTWQNRFYKKINARMKLLQQESEEISILQQAVNQLKTLRKHILTEKCD